MSLQALTHPMPSPRADTTPARIRCSRPIGVAALLGLAWLAAPVLAATPPSVPKAATSTPAPAAELRLSADQVRALGVQVSPAISETAGRPLGRFPARVVVPDGAQRLVAAPVTGVVEALPVAIGDPVRAGQAVLVLRSTAALDLQREALDRRSQADLADRAVQRDEQLLAAGVIAPSRLEATRAQAQEARRLARLREAQLADAGGALDARGGRVTISAPIDGTVLGRDAVVGERVEAGARLMQIGSLQQLWLELQVPAGVARQVQPGHRVDLGDGRGSAQVRTVARAVDPQSQTVLVRARVSDAGRLRAGEALDVELQATEAAAEPGSQRLPISALTEVMGQPLVFVEASAGVYRPSPVRVVGASADVRSVSGLPPGARVVVQGVAALKALLPTP